MRNTGFRSTAATLGFWNLNPDKNAFGLPTDRADIIVGQIFKGDVPIIDIVADAALPYLGRLFSRCIGSGFPAALFIDPVVGVGKRRILL